MSDQPLIANPFFRAQRHLLSFGIFRLILSTAVCILTFVPALYLNMFPFAEIKSLQLFSLAYLVLSILGILFAVYERPTYVSITIFLSIDIFSILMIMLNSGGISSGIGNLIFLSVGFGSLLLPLRLSLFLASIATFCVLYAELLPHDRNASHLLHAVFLSIGFFVETLFVHIITSRLLSTSKLAQDQANTIYDLRHLNELIVQKMTTGIIVCNRDGAIRLINDAAKKLSNLDKYKTFWLPAPIFERLQQWKVDEKNYSDAFQVDSDTPEIAVHFTALEESDSSDVIIFIEDNSQLRQEAQKLKLASLGRLTASIAHEVRNPLNAIGHASQLLNENELLSDSDYHLINIVNKNVKRVNVIIENVLELSRNKSNNIEAIPIETFIHACNAERELQTLYQHEQIDIKIDHNPVVYIDQQQMSQVIHNLVDNGLRYSEQNTGKRTIHMHCYLEPKEALLILEIQDQGLGVDEDAQKNLFEPFFTTENSGTGLGLYIAKELCEANRVYLQYVSDRSGACFRLNFPVNPMNTLQQSGPDNDND